MSREHVENVMEPERVEELNRLNVLKWSLSMKILVLVIGTTISYVMAYYNGSVSVYLPFISETGAHIPEMFIFSLTLYIGSCFGVIIILYQYLILQFRISARQVRLQRLNKTASLCGMLSMIGLAGVAAVPMSTVLWVHLVFAGMHFTFALIYANCMTFIIFFVPGGDTNLNRIRMALCALLMAILISLVIVFPLSQTKWFEVNSKPPALKTPQDVFFGLMLASTSLEWSMYGVYLLILGSFYFEFRNYLIVFGVAEEQN